MVEGNPTERDIRAFGRLFEAAARDLGYYLRRTLRRDDDADDIAQEALLRVWNARGSVALETARPLLFRIAANLAIDRLRERRRWRFSDIAESEPSPNEIRANQIWADEIAADRIVAAREELAAIEQAISALPENCRAAFVRSRIEGLKYAEIARDMGISTSMVEKHVAEAAYRLSLARRALR